MTVKDVKSESPEARRYRYVLEMLRPQSGNATDRMKNYIANGGNGVSINGVIDDIYALIPEAIPEDDQEMMNKSTRNEMLYAVTTATNTLHAYGV